MSTVKIRPSVIDRVFSEKLYGIFIENLGRCLYDGLLVPPDSPIDSISGMRKDILDAFRAMPVKLVRLPGGDYADNYHWADGIGPMEKRPTRVNGNWKMNDPNRFGTHEFMDMCHYLGAEPHFVVNVGSGSVEEARGWVEYCNHPGGTELSDLRTCNGRTEPFNVKIWAVGNEPFNRGGLMRAEYYSDKYRNFAYFMRLMDPSIELVLPCAITDPRGWTEKVLEMVCTGLRPVVPEHISLHAYWTSGPSQGYTDKEYEDSFARMDYILDRLRAIASLCDSYATKEKRIRLSIDEWAGWCQDAVDPLLAQHCTLRDALFSARILQYTAKMGDAVSMLCASVSINALLSLILTKGDQMSLTPAYYAYQIMSAHINGKLCDILVDNLPKNVSTLATENNNETVLSFVNDSLTEDLNIQIELEKTIQNVTASILCADDIHAENLPGQQEQVKPVKSSVPFNEKSFSIGLPKHSVCVLKIQALHQ